ncbi:hypothetical protein JXL83_00995 [candidate division WOR-3 bacterium]|nr:hypothetical protein [candidate division WOR-3 bacterium]
MKLFSSIILAFILFSPTVESSVPDLSLENRHSRVRLSLLYDPNLTMISGCENIGAVHFAITRTEDELIKVKWFDENTIPGKSAGLLVRFAKYAILDVPVDYFSVVFAHEFFGHGARYREFGIDNVHYAYDAPPPYGKGGGEASVSISGNIISQHELLGIWQGGIEAHSILNRNLGLRWMATKSIHYREAMQYFWSWQIKFRYIQDAENDLTKNVQDTDPRAYVRILNEVMGYSDPAVPLFTVEKLKSMSRLDMINPFVVFALFIGLKTYLWDGNVSSGFPAIRFGKIEYVPVVRTGLTPFGLEYHLENYLSIGHRILLMDLRIGDHTFYKSWGGFGVVFRNIYSRDRFSADLNLDLWKQPDLRFDSIPGIEKGGGVGGAFSVRGYYDFTETDYPISAVLELGYKSVGFMEGYQLDATVLFRTGIGIKI